MLPAAYPPGRSLADVLTSCLAACTGQENALALPAVSQAVVVLVDGLGAHALKARAGHARFLSGRMPKSAVIASGFPTTTASALASLTTGVASGKHGMVGYRVRDVASGRLVNQLRDWDDGRVPERWQSQTTVFERAGAEAVASFAIGPAKFAGSGFSRAVLRGSSYLSAPAIADRFEAALRVLQQGKPALVYVYIPELDTIGHSKGWESDAWLAGLEDVDALVAGFAARLGPRTGALLTADHGILDVPASAHVLFDSVPELLVGVEAVGGEPRCLQLYLEAGATEADRERLAEAWRRIEGHRSWIATRTEACEAGWFGPEVGESARERLGDVLVAARARIAYYDSRELNQAPRRMIGQHGSISPEEMRVPLIRLGAFG